jgi:hypothetical protein
MMWAVQPVMRLARAVRPDEDEGVNVGGVEAHEVVGGAGRVVEVRFDGLGLVHGRSSPLYRPSSSGRP